MALLETDDGLAAVKALDSEVESLYGNEEEETEVKETLPSPQTAGRTKKPTSWAAMAAQTSANMPKGKAGGGRGRSAGTGGSRGGRLKGGRK